MSLLYLATEGTEQQLFRAQILEKDFFYLVAVTLGKLFKLSKDQFSYLQSRNNITYSLKLVEEFKEIAHLAQCLVYKDSTKTIKMIPEMVCWGG